MAPPGAVRGALNLAFPYGGRARCGTDADLHRSVQLYIQQWFLAALNFRQAGKRPRSAACKPTRMLRFYLGCVRRTQFGGLSNAGETRRATGHESLSRGLRTPRGPRRKTWV